MVAVRVWCAQCCHNLNLKLEKISKCEMDNYFSANCMKRSLGIVVFKASGFSFH